GGGGDAKRFLFMHNHFFMFNLTYIIAFFKFKDESDIDIIVVLFVHSGQEHLPFSLIMYISVLNN
ncbi:hypothetical protein, partial [Klebsiella pneumoniae]|uniref:hypothetical protein n=1 Tax=Klebsiella pneumoniae TaxID=573 RepID=UPI0023813D47